MPVPVPPPEPPVIVESIAVEAPAVNKNKSIPPPTSIPDREELSRTALPQEISPRSTIASPPETFGPEYSPEATAASLGPPISAIAPSSTDSSPPQAETPEYALDRATAIPELKTSPELATRPPRTERAAINPSPVKPATEQILIPSLTQERASDRGPRRTRFLTQERGGDTQEFEITVPPAEAPTPEPQPLPAVEIDPEDIVEITSDRQEYDQKRRIVTAQGNVVMRFSKGVLSADFVRVNLLNRIVVAEGNVALKRGDQLLRGDRFEYFFVQDQGAIYNASGEIYQPTVGRDAAPTISESSVLSRPLSDRLLAGQPLQGVSAAEGFQFTAGGLGSNVQGANFPTGGSRGQINRQRFEAARIDFDGEVWRGTDVRVTNDPFSPPELEVRSDTATLRRIGPLQDELVLENPRLVFDQGLALPLFPRRFVFDRRDRDPGLFAIGFDDTERGGLFIERAFDIYRSDRVRFQLIPQYFVQRSTIGGEGLGPDAFGVRGGLEIDFSDRTYLKANGSLTSFDLGDVENRLRFNAQLNQQVDILNYPHALTLEANYRDRLFNGSLGFQNVQSSFGAILTSPTIALGDTGILLNYQGSVQAINADTDRIDLLPAVRDNNRINLTRYQGVAILTRTFPLWTGEPLPPTPTEGLRFTPVPVVPNVQLLTRLTGVSSYYSSGDTQPSIAAEIGISGQIGHFSRPFLDYTGFNLTYTEGIRGAPSPFLFDRFVDTRTLSFGITQQIYGPFRLGFQSQLNLNTGQEISTDYIFEYSRRTHNIILRYNPVLGLAAVSLRISDFNWNGSPQPFGGSGVRSVEQGVTR